MPSELALAIAKRNKETTETVGALQLANDADAELEEIRDVLESFAMPCVGFGNADGPCWGGISCARQGHTEQCQRARALMARLNVDGAKGEGEWYKGC